MTLTLEQILASAGIDPKDAIVFRHSYERKHADGTKPLHVDSTDAEIVAYTRAQSRDRKKFLAAPPKTWIVFLPDGGDRARLWGVLDNQGEVENVAAGRAFNLERSDQLNDLTDRLVLGWRAPRKFWVYGTTAAPYPVAEIADAEPIPFPGFDALVLSHEQLQAVMREHRYASWRTALRSVVGIYLITDTLDGRHYVGKADGTESIRQRWNEYATNGHGGNVELRKRDPKSFRFSLLRVFDPSTPTRAIDVAESHFKSALDSRKHGMNRN